MTSIVNKRRGSTALLSCAAAAALLASACGCQRMRNDTPAAINSTPMSIDEAMQRRDWNLSTATYEDKHVIAGPTEFLFEPKDDMSQQSYGLVETPIFLTNIVAMPVAAVMTPPWNEVNYSGEVIGPSYHGSPVLPDGPLQIPKGVRDPGGSNAIASGGASSGAPNSTGGASPGTGSQTGVPGSSISRTGTATPGPGGPSVAEPTAVSPGQTPGTITPGVGAGSQLPQAGTATPRVGSTGGALTGSGATGSGGTGTGATGTGAAGAGAPVAVPPLPATTRSSRSDFSAPPTTRPMGSDDLMNK